MSDGCIRSSPSANGPAIETCEHSIGIGYCKQCADAHIAALEAEVARLEALIVECHDARVEGEFSGMLRIALYAEAERIRSRTR